MVITLPSLLSRLRADRRGNVSMIVGFAILPMVFATGMGIDYSRAARLRTKLNSLADAAALAAVTKPMMNKTATEASDLAATTFTAQAALLSDLAGAPQLKVDMHGATDASAERTVTVSYTAESVNIFAGILGLRTLSIGGSSTANAMKAPNMDFYITLDTSPSMALPTTSAGIATMDTKLKCSFACHTNRIEGHTPGELPSLILDNAKFAIVKGTSYGTSGFGSDQKTIIDANGSYIYANRTATDSKCRVSASQNNDICVYNADGTFVDSYWYTNNQGIRTRITDERGAIVDLMALAQTYATKNNRKYRAGLWTFDHSTNLQEIATFPSPLTSVSALAGKVDAVLVNDKAGGGRPPNGTGGSEYLFTSYKSILDRMAANVLPTKSGQGTDAPGDTPQAFLFMVTDGMSDENIGAGRTRNAMQQAQIDTCTAIKARGIKIAILYTEYTVESIKDDEPGQRAIATAAIPKIAPALTKCASPGLMYTVTTDESISAKLQELFTNAIASAHLTQ
jgi:Flp pilus assembly protein TadG